jgi:thiol-disulfide isomerase/thioredoxin
MKLYLLCLLIAFACPLRQVNAQTTEAISFEQAYTYWQAGHGDTLLLVNFWATWCKPCVAELPCFEKISQEVFSRPVKILLISLDAPKDIHTRIKPLLKKKNIHLDCWVLEDTDPNKWINRVNPAWSGAIPATLIVSSRVSGSLSVPNQLGFEEKEFSCEALHELVQHWIVK